MMQYTHRVGAINTRNRYWTTKDVWKYWRVFGYDR